MSRAKIISKIAVVQAISVSIFFTSVSLMAQVDDRLVSQQQVAAHGELSFRVHKTPNQEVKSDGAGKIKIYGSFFKAPAEQIKSVRAVVSEGQSTSSFPVRAVVKSSTCLIAGSCRRQSFEITVDSSRLGFDRKLQVKHLIVDYENLGEVIYESNKTLKTQVPYTEGLQQKPILTGVVFDTESQRISRDLLYNPMSESFDVWTEEAKLKSFDHLDIKLKADQPLKIESYELVLREAPGEVAKEHLASSIAKDGLGTYEANGVIKSDKVVPKHHRVFVEASYLGEKAMTVSLSIFELSRQESFQNWLVNNQVDLNKLELIGVRAITEKHGSLDLSLSGEVIKINLPKAVSKKIRARQYNPNLACKISLG